MAKKKSSATNKRRLPAPQRSRSVVAQKQLAHKALIGKRKKSNKKIAIFHNFMDNIGGAEIVDLIMARKLKADIYTTNIDKEKIKKLGFKTDNIYSIGKIPINAPWRQEAAYWKFRSFKPKKHYDSYIIAGDWAMSGAVRNKPNLWYVYSPIREIYDLHEYVRKNIVPWYSRFNFFLWVKYRRFLNKRDLKHVQKIVSISKNTQSRVSKYLHRDSKIIHPPTETKNYRYKKHKGYWLSVNRFVKHKRIEMQLEAFRKMPNEKLIIVASYEKARHFEKYKNEIFKNLPKNVEIKSWISNKELIKLYSECKGLIATAQDEDYGLSIVEAMASGKPCIAGKEGGYKETLTKNTGILIDNITPEKIAKAVKSIKNPEKYKSACIKRAKNFSTTKFINSIKKIIEA